MKTKLKDFAEAAPATAQAWAPGAGSVDVLSEGDPRWISPTPELPSSREPSLPRAGRLKGMATGIALGLTGAMAVIGLWQLAALYRPDLPGPVEVFRQLATMMRTPFANNGPNDKGVLLQVSLSLGKVFAGFGLAAAVGVPLGFLIGGSKTIWRALNPVIQVLRPVSPLAWFPIALVLMKDTGKAGIFTIAITAIWPVVLNTAAGVQGVPQDHRNVARVFKFSRLKYIRHVLLPHSLSSIFTGLRLSMGIAWMVIVATEMLSVGTGIGFFVWDSYNNNNIAAVISAIFFIGGVGFILDTAFSRLSMRFSYSGGAN